MLIESATFVVADTETTGLDPSRCRLIELGAVRITNGKVVDRLASLVNPGRSVPRRITEITGISTGMVFDQPDAEAVLDRFLDFLGDAVLVGHNLSYDRQVIDSELARLGARGLDNRGLCTRRMGRRLLPGLKSKSLASMADFYKIPVKTRHRALPDAETTAAVFLKLLRGVEFQHRITELSDLLTFQRRRYSIASAGAKQIAEVRDRVMPTLPRSPGVYLMKDASGEIIYVGKAKNLRRRVRQYFRAPDSHPPRIGRLVRSIRDVDWRNTETELEALLLESRLIKKLQPEFNRASRRYSRLVFIRVPTNSDFPAVSASRNIHDDAAEYYGPISGERLARAIVEMINQSFKLRECDDRTLRLGRPCFYASIGRCLSPCNGACSADEYDGELTKVRRFLAGDTEEVIDNLKRKMAAASRDMKFEDACALRDWVAELDNLTARQRFVAAPVRGHNSVVVHRPGNNSTAINVFVVRHGRHVETLTLGNPAGRECESRLRQRLHHHLDAARAKPESYGLSDLDEIRVLVSWLYLKREEIRQVHWSADEPVDRIAGKVVASLKAVEAEAASQ